MSGERDGRTRLGPDSSFWNAVRRARSSVLMHYGTATAAETDDNGNVESLSKIVKQQQQETK